MKTVRIGNATVRSINLGDLSMKLKDVDNVPESEWRPLYSDIFENANLYPSQCFHILHPEASILVDAGDYALFAALEPSYLPKDNHPPPGLIEQLLHEGIRSEKITHVVITHAHYDHYSGVTRKERDGKFVPTFPNAKYFLGKADWENPETQKALTNPESEDSRTLGVLRRSGVLELVEEELELTPNVKVIPAPGESLGHQIVRVNSDNITLYCVGDLFHHAVEVENPTWMPVWANTRKSLDSRTSFIKACIKEQAIMAAAHMPWGKLERNGNTAKFVPI